MDELLYLFIKNLIIIISATNKKLIKHNRVKKERNSIDWIQIVYLKLKIRSI